MNDYEVFETSSTIDGRPTGHWRMKSFAFLTRHAPTAGQIKLAAQAGIELVPVGDRDAFAVDPAEFAGFDGAVVVHPAAALRLKGFPERCAGECQHDLCNRLPIEKAMFRVGIFENANRAPEGEKPQFEASALHIF